MYGRKVGLNPQQRFPLSIITQEAVKNTDKPLKQLCTIVCAFRLHLIAPLQLSISATRVLRDVKDM